MRATYTNLATALVGMVLLTASMVQAQSTEPDLKLLPAKAASSARQAEAQALEVMYAFMRSFKSLRIPGIERAHKGIHHL